MGKSRANPEEAIAAYLQGLTPEELLSLVRELAATSDRAREMLTLRATTRTGRAADLLRAARALLRRLTAERGWSNHWSDDGYTPDYTPLKEHLLALLAAGQADLVLDLGRELLEQSAAQIEESNDEGETCQEVATCLAVVADALDSCSLSPAERVLWALDCELADEFSVCDGAFDGVRAQTDSAAWSEVADALALRLYGGAAPADRPDRYRRRELTGYLLAALEQAGRTDEAIAVAVREAALTHDYLRAVDLLTEAGREDDAARLAREGLAKLHREEPGTAAFLRSRLRDPRCPSGRPAPRRGPGRGGVLRPSLRAGLPAPPRLRRGRRRLARGAPLCPGDAGVR